MCIVLKCRSLQIDNLYIISIVHALCFPCFYFASKYRWSLIWGRNSETTREYYLERRNKLSETFSSNVDNFWYCLSHCNYCIAMQTALSLCNVHWFRRKSRIMKIGSMGFGLCRIFDQIQCSSQRMKFGCSGNKKAVAHPNGYFRTNRFLFILISTLIRCIENLRKSYIFSHICNKLHRPHKCIHYTELFPFKIERMTKT